MERRFATSSRIGLVGLRPRCRRSASALRVRLRLLDGGLRFFQLPQLSLVQLLFSGSRPSPALIDARLIRESSIREHSVGIDADLLVDRATIESMPKFSWRFGPPATCAPASMTSSASPASRSRRRSSPSTRRETPAPVRNETAGRLPER